MKTKISILIAAIIICLASGCATWEGGSASWSGSGTSIFISNY